MKKGKSIIRLIVLCVLIIALIQVVRNSFHEDERRVRKQIRETVKEKFPEEVSQFEAIYGLRPFKQTDNLRQYDEHSPEVILIHGLDDPGKVWMNLAPVLIQEGFYVRIMTYPNDQPITESARFFTEQIKSNHPPGSEGVSIIAHSMGGLVAREMLTHPELSYCEKAKKGELPSVKKLIMIGTPNHGSELAPFRIFAEFRDQLANWGNENYFWLRFILDGAGEAGIELIPGSRFLTQLNNRPNPEGVEMLVIAGFMTPWKEDDIDELIQRLEMELPGDIMGSVRKLDEVLSSMKEKVGDGLVSVDSARLDDVPLKLVQGTHLTIIRNMKKDSRRMPPAVPIILEQLYPLINDH